jgi:dTDP-4-amino-4,6-dideoxygalactose transaminase
MKLMIKLFDMDARLLRHKKQLVQIITNVIESGNFIQGEEVEKFESKFSHYTGAKSCISVGNATDGLEIALKALGIGKGDKVITVANAGYYATAAILNIGAIPTYIDVELETFNMDTDLFLSSKISESKCLIITHLYGMPVLDILKVVDYCKVNGIRVIEDCSQSHGSRLEGRHVGTFGDIGVFSFYPTKNLGALGDAGCLITSDVDLERNIRKIRNYGWKSKYHVDILGGRNSRMDEIQAAVLSYFLLELDSQIDLRKEKARVYQNHLDKNLVTFQKIHDSNSYHLFVIRVKNRDQLIDNLRKNEIDTAIHFPIPDYLQKANFSNKITLPITEKLSSEIMSLPFYPEISSKTIEYVCRYVNQAVVT